MNSNVLPDQWVQGAVWPVDHWFRAISQWRRRKV